MPTQRTVMHRAVPNIGNKTRTVDDEIKDSGLDEIVIAATISGRPPGLLMHNPASMRNTSTRIKNIGDIPSPEKEAEDAAYKQKDGTLFIPSTAIYGSMIGASSLTKVGRSSASRYVAAALRVFPLEIPLLDLKGNPLRKYEIDIRSAVIQRNRILRARPLIRDWTAQFQLLADPKLITFSVIQQILQNAGRQFGILDFRPQKRGPFGIFDVTSFEWTRQ